MKKIKKVCLIEDDDIQVYLLRKLLQKTGRVLDIIDYRNGKAAYDAMKELVDTGEQLPELIFLDLNMPLWDGWEFLREFSKLDGFPEVNIWILTSSLSPNDYEKAEGYGLREQYISKPIEFSIMHRILDEVTG